MKHLRRRALVAVAASMFLALSACGSSDSSSDGEDSAAGSSSQVEDGAFPVTIDHKFGSTTLTKEPQRVVAVGLTEQDALLALGTDPVAVTEWFGDAKGFIFPWAQQALGDGALPQVLTTTDGLQLEKIISFKPDLIIGQYAGVTKEEFAKLEAIAPTVVQPKEYTDYGVPWQVGTENIGKALGRPAAAKELISKTEATIADYATKNPDIKGKTAIVLTPYDGIFFYGPEDPRSRILTELGFTFPIDTIKGIDKSEFGTSISPEQFSRFKDVDVIVWLATEKQVNDGTGGLWAKSDAAKQGRGVFISEADADYYVGHSFVTPLSIPYVLERYVPQLAAAVDADPATKVPAAKP